MSWMIRVAESADAVRLPPVERSAGQRFRQIPDLAWLADGDDLSLAAHERYIAQGTEWVAVNEAQEPIGFLAAEIIDRDLHIWEIAVRADLQNRGIGRQLMEAASAFARERHLATLTLTTFLDVPWNAPWYVRLGFEVCNGDLRLAERVRIENERGLSGRCAMRMAVAQLVAPDAIVVSPGEASEIGAFLAQRIEEYNAKATGYFDGKSFAAASRNESGAMRAGISGYTWGGCCYITSLWVEESQRRRGLGAALLGAAERYAGSLGCQVVFLSTHSFQAPGFYERRGYAVQSVLPDHPVGHANLVLAKRLKGGASAAVESGEN